MAYIDEIDAKVIEIFNKRKGISFKDQRENDIRLVGVAISRNNIWLISTKNELTFDDIDVSVSFIYSVFGKPSEGYSIFDEDYIKTIDKRKNSLCFKSIRKTSKDLKIDFENIQKYINKFDRLSKLLNL